MTDSLVISSIENGVGRLRLNRPDKRNALNSELVNAATETMARFAEDDDVVAIVIEGTNGAFSAGADMIESLAAYESGQRRFNPSSQLTQVVQASTKPTIAAVDGPAYGAGAVLACSCDIRIFTERARFRLPGSDYGLVVGAVVLPRIVGNPIAKEIIFSGRVVEAEEAARIGLANRVVSEAEFEATVNELANTIAAASPLALEWGKRVIDATTNGGDAVGIDRQADILLRGGPDNMWRFARATERVTGKGGSKKEGAQ